ncbi:3-keto-disaccharide hydrolase [Spirosoma areae]
MKLLFLSGCLSLFPLALLNAQSTSNSGKWQSLFNGKDFDGWETYLDRPYIAGSQDKQASPIGLDNDPNHVFSVTKVDGKSALRISGETFGGINTLAEFENYHLRLEFKWGNKKWPPKLDQPRDSGLLYHSVGPHGTPMLWMESFELQIQEGDCGDYWGVMNVLADIAARKDDNGKYVYQPDATPITFQDKTPVGRSCLKQPDNEKPSGQWNVVDLYCVGDTCLHVLNGKVNLMLTHTRHLIDGQVVPLTKGKIQLQSEGAEVFYRNIQVRHIRQLPAELLR